MSDQDSAASIGERSGLDGERNDLDEERSDLGEEISLTEDEVAARDAFVASVRKLYNAGTPLFTKEMIRLAQDQADRIAEGSISPDKLEQLGFDGNMHSQSFSPCFFNTTDPVEILFPVVEYRSFESLTMLPPYSQPDLLLVSVSIIGLCGGVNRVSDIPKDDAMCAFDKCFDLWEQSKEWASLKEQIRPHLPTLPMTIDKIIGFGLGIITIEGECDVDNERGRQCSEQHALMLTLAKMFQEYTGNSVKCYAQDPGYFDTCKDVLGRRGVDVVHGDTGFLLVDENSIVLSFYPNIPVRQVIADLTRPAMMVCNIISESKRSEWRRRKGVYLSPFTTDPVSPRVLAMKEEYIELPINTIASLGESAAYIRKEKMSKPFGGQSTSS